MFARYYLMTHLSSFCSLQITFPGVKLRTFQILLQYMYTDTIPTLKIRECLPIVELGNRLCLPRLISLVEIEIIDLFQRVIQAGGDVSEDCIYLLEPLQVIFLISSFQYILTNFSLYAV